MPIQIDKILSAGLFTIDGKKVLDLTDTVCDISYETLDMPNDFRLNVPEEISCDVKWNIGSLKSLNKLAYGWKASGPIRRRVLRKLWGW